MNIAVLGQPPRNLEKSQFLAMKAVILEPTN